MSSPTRAEAEPVDAPLAMRRRDVANGTFSGLSHGAAILILVLLAAVATFLILEALPALTASAADLAEAVDWLGTEPNETLMANIGFLVFGTLVISALAILISAPISYGIALFISHYAPRRLSSTLGYAVDLLAAIPSVVYGLWGLLVLVPALLPTLEWIESTFGWIPFFEGRETAGGDTTVGTGRVALAAAVVLAIMILPIITAVTREVFLQTPKLHEEAALAMGATKWEMVRMAVVPYGRPGMIGATMLGLGRALGETMAVMMVLTPASVIEYTASVLKPASHNTIAAQIALKFPESDGDGVAALIAMGLALFVITLAVNMVARWVVSRRAQFSGAN